MIVCICTYSIILCTFFNHTLPAKDGAHVHNSAQNAPLRSTHATRKVLIRGVWLLLFCFSQENAQRTRDTANSAGHCILQGTRIMHSDSTLGPPRIAFIVIVRQSFDNKRIVGAFHYLVGRCTMVLLASTYYRAA